MMNSAMVPNSSANAKNTAVPIVICLLAPVIDYIVRIVSVLVLPVLLLIPALRLLYSITSYHQVSLFDWRIVWLLIANPYGNAEL